MPEGRRTLVLGENQVAKMRISCKGQPIHDDGYELVKRSL